MNSECIPPNPHTCHIPILSSSPTFYPINLRASPIIAFLGASTKSCCRLFRRWASLWNAFEAVLAIGSAATVFSTPGSTRAEVSRPFGFIRVLRVVRYSRGMAGVGGTLFLAGRAMLTILGSIGIVAFAYAGTLQGSASRFSKANAYLLL